MAPTVEVEGLPSSDGKISGPDSEKAYVTFLAGAGDYVKGVVGLAKGLRKVKSANYPLVVAILPDVPEEHREILRKQGCIVKEIVPIYPPDNQIQFAMAYVRHQLLQAPHLEYVEPLAAVLDWVLPAVPREGDMARGDGPATPTVLQRGHVRVRAQQHHLQRPSRHPAHITPPDPFAEQDFLNMFFEKVYKPIPLIYNLVLAMMWRHPENVDLPKVEVVHYCAAGSKPWRYTGEEANMDREDIKMLVKKWWDVYDDESLDFKATSRWISDKMLVKLIDLLKSP